MQTKQQLLRQLQQQLALAKERQWLSAHTARDTGRARAEASALKRRGVPRNYDGQWRTSRACRLLRHAGGIRAKPADGLLNKRPRVGGMVLQDWWFRAAAGAAFAARWVSFI